MRARGPVAALLLLFLAPPCADGGADPAYLVKDLSTTPLERGDSAPREFVVLDGIAYFTADDGWHGRELWRSDGTAAGTRLVADIDPGEGSSSPGDLTVIGDDLWFRAWNGWRGCGLWRSDGTAAGTMEVAILHAALDACGSDGSPTAFTGLGDLVLFAASSPDSGAELWRSDGTGSGTFPVEDIAPGPDGSEPLALTALAGVLYFVADDGEHGAELWRSDGTADGTRMVRDIQPGRGSAIPGPRRNGRLASAGGALLFAAGDGTHGTELWRSDGTEEGTALLLDTAPGFPLDGLRLGDAISPVISVGPDAVFFSTDRREHPPHLQLWRSDGTAAGTMPVGTIPLDDGWIAPANLTAVGSLGFFSLGTHSASAVWRVDDDSIEPLASFSGTATQAGAFTAVGDHVLFLAPIEDTGCGLWRSDGSAAGTELVRSGAARGGQCPIDAGTSPPGTYLVAVDAGALLAGTDAGPGTELFASDGTTEGTRLLRDINDTSGRTQGSFIALSDAIALDDVLLFTATAEIGATHLWRSDGTADGTAAVAAVWVGDGAVIGDRAVFTGDDAQGHALWISDGTAGGTARVLSLPAESIGTATPAGFFLTLDLGEGGSQLLVSDGTAANTIPLQTTQGGRLGPQVAFAGGLATIVYDQERSALWLSDGTPAGTRYVRTFPLPRGRVHDLVDVDGTLYLTLASFERGPELWRSDGTLPGTVLVADLGAGGRAVSPAWLAPGPGALFFAGFDAVAGMSCGARTAPTPARHG